MSILDFRKRTVSPGIPPLNYGRVYVNADGSLRFVNDAGTEVSLSGAQEAVSNPLFSSLALSQLVSQPAAPAPGSSKMWVSADGKLHIYDGTTDKVIGEDVQVTGQIKAFGMAQRTAYASTGSITYVDIPDTTITLNLPSTCTVVLIGSGTMRSTDDSSGYIRGSVDGTPDASDVHCQFYDTNAYNHPFMPFGYTWMKTGVPAGGRVVNLQYKNSNSEHMTQIYTATLIALAISE